MTSATSTPSSIGTSSNDDVTGKLMSDKNKLDSHLDRDIHTTLSKSRDKSAAEKPTTTTTSSLMHVEDSRVESTTGQPRENVASDKSVMKNSSSLTGSREGNTSS